jgi:4-hydroxy-tetrahydrodipicolinate synthase
MDAGASGGMINPAQGLKTEEAVAGWFDGFVAALGGDIPIVLQDCPQLSGVFLSVETLNRLFVRHPSIKVLKHHEEGSAMQTLAAARR